MSRLFLDANIFLHAVGREHPLRDPCRKILREVGEEKIDAVTSVEVVQEVLYVLRRRGRGKEAVSLARSLLELFPDLLSITAKEMDDACTLVEEYPHLTIRDAVHAATMRSHNLAAIVTADRHFEIIEGLHRIDPASR